MSENGTIADTSRGTQSPAALPKGSFVLGVKGFTLWLGGSLAALTAILYAVVYLVVDAKMAEPAVRHVQVHLFTQPPFGTNPVAIANDEHADDQFGIDRWAAGMAVEILKMRAEFGQVQIPVDRSQQVIMGNEFFQINKFGPFSPYNFLPHHDPASLVRVVLTP